MDQLAIAKRNVAWQINLVKDTLVAYKNATDVSSRFQNHVPRVIKF